MPIIACGLNHHTARIALREKVIFSQEKLALYLSDLQRTENISEALILSTCNRSEIYCETDDVERLIDWFCKQHSVSRKEIAPSLYIYRDQEAVQHVMMVACGLNSMVLGEPQILGQMKEAFTESCVAGTVGSLFHKLFQAVFAVAKEVRSSTDIGACPVSISSAAIHFIQQFSHKPLPLSSVVLIGAGDVIQLSLRYLQPHQVAKLTIVNRHPETAKALAENFSADSVPLEKLAYALADADIVISATGSLTPIVTRTMLEKRKTPIFMLDIAVPRDIDPEVAALPHVALHSIDDLKKIIQQHLQGREHAAEKAREMIQHKCQEFMTWLHAVEKVTSTIRWYRKQVEDLCSAELVKAQKQLQRGDDPEQVLMSFAYAFTNKLLHAPSIQLRQAGFAGRFDILEYAQQLLSVPASELS